MAIRFLLKPSPLEAEQAQLPILKHHAFQAFNHPSDPLQFVIVFFYTVVVVRGVKYDMVL